MTRVNLISISESIRMQHAFCAKIFIGRTLLEEKHQITPRDRADHEYVECNLLLKKIK